MARVKILKAFTYNVFKSLQGGPADRFGQPESGSVHDPEILQAEARQRASAERSVRNTTIGSKGKL
jgi:hypothetical protein